MNATLRPPLVVREGQTVPVGDDATSPSKPAPSPADGVAAPLLTRRDADALEALGERLGIHLVEPAGRGRVRFRQYVGLVRVHGRSVELLPKIDSAATGDAGVPAVRRSLLHMLLAAQDVTTLHLPGEAAAAFTQAGWLDAFVRLFCLTLAPQVHRGLASRYREVEDDDAFALRGRLRLDAQAIRAPSHGAGLACAYDELDEDHPLNRLFKRALAGMAQAAQGDAARRAARSLLTAFERVGLDDPPPAVAARAEAPRPDRLTARFEPARRLAELFLAGLGPDVAAGGTDAFALLFDMNALFEAYVGRLLKRHLTAQGWTVALQHARHHLVRDAAAPGTAKDRLLLRPDIVVSRDGRVACLADTKWKRLAPTERSLGVAAADLYQMLAYADRYRCERVLLLYPFERTPGALPPGTGRRLAYQGRRTTVVVGQVDLGDLATVPQQVDALFRQAVEDMPTTSGDAAPSVIV